MPWIWRPLWGPIWIKSYRRPKRQKNVEVCAEKDMNGKNLSCKNRSNQSSTVSRRDLFASKFHVANGENPRKLANNKRTNKSNAPCELINGKNLETFLKEQFQQVEAGIFQFKSSGVAAGGEQTPTTSRDSKPTQSEKNGAIAGDGPSFREKYQKIGTTTDGIPIYTFT